ncbi:hypothetical protein [Ruminococcus flavefaciens]|uniref:hypothetical protein n=1 Tax=Ruminococcus flavefaciens TaxID=1265 RepID=UPI0026EB7B15|nr:hypothetical protein [Ruminococcus flavefaciens]
MKSKIRSVLSVLVCIILVFVIIGTTGAIMADKLYTAQYFRDQIDKTNTYQNAYNAMIKEFSDNYSVSNIPVEVYEKSFTKEWMRNAIDEKINSTFEEREADIDCSAVEKNITEYFEDYAHEAHVMKDETYDKKLAESIMYAEKTAMNVADVYSLDVMKRAGITAKVSSYVELARKYMYPCIGLAIILLIILMILRRPVYWGGTALFASGVLMTVPTAVVLMNDMIQRFSLKNYMTYNLVTGVLETVTKNAMITGIVMLLIGLVMIIISIVYNHNKTKARI